MQLTDYEIAVAVDASENSLRAARMAASMARLTGKPLHLIHVFQGRPEELVDMDSLPGDIQAVIHLSAEEVAQARERTGRKVFDQVLAGADLRDLGPEEVLLSGDPAEELLAWLEKRPKTLMVLGRRGLSRIRGLLTGSVSDKVIHHAGTPVLIVD